MRIGVDFRPPLFSSAGIARATAELVLGLGQQRDVELVLYGDAWRRMEDPAKVDDLVHRSGARLIRARIPARLMGALGRVGVGLEARTGPLDLFHYTDLVYPPLKRTPYVMTLHDVVFEVDRSLHGAAFHRSVPDRVRRALASARAVIVSSAETRKQIVERGLAAAERVFVVPLGGDHMLRMEASSDDARARACNDAISLRERYMICVGTIEPRKNHARLLDAYERMGDPRTRPGLLIVGRPGWLCDDVVLRLRSGIPGVVHLTDVDDLALPGLYRGAEFAVYPSLYEGFGLPVLEAMTLGVPVLTTRGGALPEVGGDAVRYADAGDVDSLANEMQALAGDLQARRALALAGQVRARQFMWAKTASAVRDVYQSAISAGP